MPEAHKTYDNIDTEEPMYWEIELNLPHVVISMETNWQKEKLELLDNEIVESLNSSGQTYHKVQMRVDEGGKHIISLIKIMIIHVKGFSVGWDACSPYLDFSLSSIRHLLFLITVIGLLLLLSSMIGKCYIRCRKAKCKTNSKKTQIMVAQN